MISHLHQEGNAGYYFKLPERTTIWWTNGSPPPLTGYDSDLFYGVNPAVAMKTANQRARNEDIAAINCLFADVDAKQFGDVDGDGLEACKRRALSHIQSLTERPTVIIDSGGGYHCYWYINAPFIIDTDQKREEAAKLQSDWVTHVGADPAAKDLARILRPPGTRNSKYPGGREVKIIEYNDNLYSLDDLTTACHIEEVSPSSGSTMKPQHSNPDRKMAVPLSDPDEQALLAHIEKVSGAAIEKRGDEYWCRCPHPDHDDNTPSFSVNFEKSIYNCLGCNRSGTVRQLAQELDVGVNGNTTNSKSDPFSGEYKATVDGLVWLKREGDDVIPISLTNFNARIISDTTHDDGAEQRHEFGIESEFKGQNRTFSLSPARFMGMNWPMEEIGAGAILKPGQAIKDRTRVAIQTLSQDAVTETIYTHTGWREIDSRHVYLHNGGGIDENGHVDSVSVALPGALDRFILPPVTDQKSLRNAVAACIQFLGVAALEIMVPLIAAVFRTILGNVDFSVYMVGPSGAGKTVLASLVQQFYGPGLDAGHLPGSWSGTANANEGLAFILKDVLVVIDDFAPGGSSNDISRQHRDADRVIRAQGNHSARSRMRPDGSLRPDKPPRGTILSTGEDIPNGHSLRARMLILEIGPRTLDWSAVSRSQTDGAQGQFALSNSGFIQWAAARYDEIQKHIPLRISELRAQLSGAHARMPNMGANLIIGIEYFLKFTVDMGVHSEEEGAALLKSWTQAIVQAIGLQGQYHTTEEPAQRFIELVRVALTTGKAYVSDFSGQAPLFSRPWGWKSEYPKGDHIGWVKGQDLYLDSHAAYLAAQNVTTHSNGIAINQQTLHKRLEEKGLLKTTEKESRNTITVRKMIDGARRTVLHMEASIFVENDPDALDEPVQVESPVHSDPEKDRDVFFEDDKV
jgi:hypothetical protein